MAGLHLCAHDAGACFPPIEEVIPMWRLIKR